MFRIRKKIILLCLLSLQVSNYLYSGVYQYHPSSALYLGVGFDPLHPDVAYRQCLEYEGLQSVDGSGALSTNYSMSLVKSRKDLYEKLGVSASMSARGFFWGASASVDYFSEHSFHSDSVTWMLMGKTQYGRYELMNPKLNLEAQKLIDDNKFQKFENMCGSEFVKLERRQVLISSVFSVSNVSEAQKEKLEMQFEASYDGGFFELDAKAKYAKFYSAASALSRVSMTIFAIGGNGITHFSEIIEAPDDLEKVQNLLRTYMDNLTVDKAAPAEYVTGSMAAFGWQGETEFGVYRRERILGELFHLYKEEMSKYERVNRIISLQNSAFYKKLDQADIENYDSQLDLLRLNLTEIIEKADACYEDWAVCQLPNIEPVFVSWPMSLVDDCEKMRLQAHRIGLINDSKLERLRITNMAPIFRSFEEGVVAEVFCQN